MPASNITTVGLLANTETNVIGPNDNRKSITFTGPDLGTAYLRNDSLGNNKGGLVLTLNVGALTLTRAEHGDVVTKPWLAFNTSTSTIGVLEVIY